MRNINLTVNGKAVSASVEPRTHLADFLRESLNLTGTHLGCEHGVCGACTLLVDGVPVRSCITLAVACDGASVTTVEGLDEDEIAGALRAAFMREHGLQCGYCTPGILASARDIVIRMPDAAAQDIRVAMSGNLCRCTGYVGIVRAIEDVISERRAKALLAPPGALVEVGPAGSGRARPPAGSVQAAPPASRAEKRAAPAGAPEATAARGGAAEPRGKPQTTLCESFTVEHPRAEVWAFFGRLGDIATCLPGTSLLGTPTHDHVEARIRIKVGPIVSEFDGAADAVRDPASFSGAIRGSGQDARSRSSTRGEIRYVLHEEGGGVTRVEVEVGFTLTGPLAQFSRSTLIHDIARRMTGAFAQNLHARLSKGGDAPGAPAAELDAGGLFFSALVSRIKRVVRGLLRR
jgi:aerobic carbon-monoxide dehydrogenase small subunit